VQLASYLEGIGTGIGFMLILIAGVSGIAIRKINSNPMAKMVVNRVVKTARKQRKTRKEMETAVAGITSQQ
jgi:hypothetical protein